MSIHKTNTRDRFIHHEVIEEWDIRSANTSLMRKYKLIPPSQIDRLESLPKDKREVRVGLMLQKNKEFGLALEEAFTFIINEFIEANRLDPENDIVSIKKDAVFVRSRELRKNEFGDDIIDQNGITRPPVQFIRKNCYSGFLYLPQYEVYYSPNGFTIKGIADDSVPLHENGMLYLFKSVFDLSRDRTELNAFLKEYAGYYKRRELDFDAYREFTSDSKFRVNMFGNELTMDNINEELLELTDISYNYKNVYLEILKVIAR